MHQRSPFEAARLPGVWLGLTLLTLGCGSGVRAPFNGSGGEATGGGNVAVGNDAGASHAGTGGSSPATAGGAPASSAGASGGSPDPGASGGPPQTAGTPGAGGSAGMGGSAGAGGTAPPPASDLWIAPDGDDQHAGTEAEPLQNLPYAVARLKAGFTIWIKAGTYSYTNTISLSKSGSAAHPFAISGAPGARPVIHFDTPAGGRGFEIQGNYWKLARLEVENASDNCVAISGSHNIVEELTIHGCGDTGLQITVGTSQVADATRGADNLILNTDSYGNFDVASGGENADGFAAKLRIGAGNVFRGCRAYDNADDGWDLFAADDVVEIDDCWAFSNGKTFAGNNPAGDGNGFKLGGKPNGEGQGGAVHLVNDSFAFENLTCGYTRNSNPEQPLLTGCGAKDNETDYCQTLSQAEEASMSMSAEQARATPRNPDGSLPPMQ